MSIIQGVRRGASGPLGGTLSTEDIALWRGLMRATGMTNHPAVLHPLQTPRHWGIQNSWFRLRQKPLPRYITAIKGARV